ncbi:YopX family protein [Enterococcus faecalis]|uniref:YopX family protein n=1 Tax=Enterococcus faecalis TaxID=1351 RepID=UPI0011592D48|nr:YopX family protein [Enterococcus faecalis]UYY51895.1 YopX family protein [Enterococcus faecalis]HCR3320323.1 hypothetical protein [Enterococcus faecalis]
MIPKFRAWDKRENTMRDVAVLHFTKGGKVNSIEYWKTPSELKSYHVRNLVLMQSTGLKDKNQVESWEGNYLTKEGCWPFFIKRIENEGCLMAVPANGVQRTNWKPVSVKELLDTGYVNNGNIYENPELLEVK